MNMEPLRLEKYSVSFLQVSGRNMFISRLKYNLVLFVLLSNLELLTNGTVTHAWTSLIEHTKLLHKLHHGLLLWGALGIASALRLGDFWNRKVASEKYKNVKDIELNTLTYSMSWNKNPEHHVQTEGLWSLSLMLRASYWQGPGRHRKCQEKGKFSSGCVHGAGGGGLCFFSRLLYPKTWVRFLPLNASNCEIHSL